MNRVRAPFLALVLAQVAHSVEEYVGRLWETFPPAALLTGLVSDNREIGFLVINVAFVMFGLWCWLVPLRRGSRAAQRLIWFWVVVEAINGLGHMAWSIAQRAYMAGVLTAPVLLVLALYIATRLRRD